MLIVKPVGDRDEPFIELQIPRLVPIGVNFRALVTEPGIPPWAFSVALYGATSVRGRLRPASVVKKAVAAPHTDCGFGGYHPYRAA